MSVAGAAAAAAAAAAPASPMDDEGPDVQAPLDAAAALRARKTAAAEAAAAAACVDLAAKAKGCPYSKLHSSAQVLLLADAELWDTIAENWCKPGAEIIEAIVDTWEGPDLAACVYKLRLPVLYAKKNYALHMRRSVVAAVRAHARAHPELFEEPDSEDEEKEPAAAPAEEEKQAAPAPPRAVTPPPVHPPGEVVVQQRRSPRAPASSRSAAAMAMAALDALPDRHGSPAQARAAMRSPPAPRHGADRARAARPPAIVPLRLHDAGAGASEPSDDSGSEDSDWQPSEGPADRLYDPLRASLRRGGRLADDDMEDALAQAGVQRSFARGFVANARFAAGGRSMFQLYKEVTAGFPTESSKRECLALARILDALLRGDTAAALEHTCRRLGGVHTAAETGNWAMCERLETEAEQRSFVPDAFMRSALKSVTQMQAVKKSAAESAAGRGALSKAASGSGRAERRSAGSKPYNKKESHKSKDTGDAGASTSQKKKSGSGDSR